MENVGHVHAGAYTNILAIHAKTFIIVVIHV